MDIYMKSQPEKDTGTKLIEVRVFLPGKDIFMSQEAGDFISAAQQLYDKLKRKLRDYKEIDKERRHH
jgi:putative sigma-54 modulation protein